MSFICRRVYTSDMSFQAYLDTIKAKTGKEPKDFLALAGARGLLEPGVKPGAIVAWLKEDFGLGRGHAMAVVLTLQTATQPKASTDERLDRHFSGGRARWRETYERLIADLRTLGRDVSVAPTDSYISLLRKGRKFGVLGVTKDRLDVGIKLRELDAAGRLEPAGDWNSMVTHRVRVTDPAEADGQLVGWLRQAYERA